MLVMIMLFTIIFFSLNSIDLLYCNCSDFFEPVVSDAGLLLAGTVQVACSFGTVIMGLFCKLTLIIRAM